MAAGWNDAPAGAAAERAEGPSPFLRLPAAMTRHWRHAAWAIAWLAISAAGAAWIVRAELAVQQEDFETNARIAHRLLSQQVVQHDAILATLALLQPPAQVTPSDQPEQRLPAVYPEILSVQRRDPDVQWPAPLRAMLDAAETESRTARRTAIADVDFAHARYRLVLAARPASYALQIDLNATVPWAEWPMARDTSPIRVSLDHAGQHFVVQPGHIEGRGWRFEFHKQLASESQPFDVIAIREVSWSELPWPWMLAWTLATLAALWGFRAWQGQRAERRRAEELLRLGQVARLNTLGELAAGMAHELNQPLTAVLANTQAASRLLREDPPDLSIVRNAMTQAAEQARRASDVVGRLRRAVERPDASGHTLPVRLHDAISNVLYLLEPEFQRRAVRPIVAPAGAAVSVLADPVALEQIIHNLLMNALQALEQVPPEQRRLRLTVARTSADATVAFIDSGPGIPADVLPRIFEPFYSTREGGLGLGLSLCESLAAGMGGSLTAHPHAPRGAEFRLSLPLASAGVKQ